MEDYAGVEGKYYEGYRHFDGKYYEGYLPKYAFERYAGAYCESHSWPDREICNAFFPPVWNDFKQYSVNGAAQPAGWESLYGIERQKQRKLDRGRANARLFQMYGNFHVVKAVLKGGIRDPDVLMDHIKEVLHFYTVQETTTALAHDRLGERVAAGTSSEGQEAISPGTRVSTS